MKRSVLILVAALAAAVASCEMKSPAVDVTPVDVPCSFSLSPDSSATRGRYEDSMMDRISNVVVSIYRDGRLCYGYTTYHTSTEFTLSIPDPDGVYDIYFLANLGDQRDVLNNYYTTTQQMDAYVHELDDYSTFGKWGVPMARKLSGWTRGKSTDVVLERLVSKMDIRFTNTSGYKVDIKSMSLKQSACKVAPFMDAFRAADPGDVLPSDSMNDFLTADDLQKAMDGGTVHLYCCENMQGDLLPGITKQSEKSLTALDASLARLVTYFEITARVQGPGVVWNDVHYRFCLGKNNTVNFDVPRNMALSYTIDFAKAPADTDWTVEPGQPEFETEIQYTLEEAMYNPGWSVFTFPEASTAKPVQLQCNGKTYTVDGASRPRVSLDAMGEECIVYRDKAYVRCLGETGISMSCNGGTPKSVTIPAKEKLSFFLTRNNQEGALVKVAYMRTSTGTQLGLSAYSAMNRTYVPWSMIQFPQQLFTHFGPTYVNNFWNARLNASFTSSQSASGPGSPASSVLSYAVFDSASDTPGFYVKPPSAECYLSYDISIDGMGVETGGGHSIRAFLIDNQPVVGTLPASVVVNNAGDLSNPARNTKQTWNIAENASLLAQYKPGIQVYKGVAAPYGKMSFGYNSTTGLFTFTFNEYSSGRGKIRLLYWDYDKAPSGWIEKPIDVYMDVSYVPSFGVLRNDGVYPSKHFSGTGVVRDEDITTVSSHVWGYQFMAAHVQSRFRTNDMPSDAQQEMFECINSHAPGLVSGFYGTSARVAMYNAGNILYNEEYPSEGDMPNGGTILFCDPAENDNCVWSLSYRSAQPLPDCYYMYPFVTGTPASSLAAAAQSHLWDCNHYNPFFREGQISGKDFERRDIGNGILVNYHLKTDTCLELLTGDWNNY